MPRKKKVNPGPPHRPLIPIDWNVVDHLLECGCIGTEVAAAIGIHEDTLYLRTQIEKGLAFSAYRASKVAKGDSLLRAKQVELAVSGDKTMLVWLGKQRLGQTEKNDPNAMAAVINVTINETPA